MTQQKEICMRNIVARHHEEFIQSILKQPFRPAFIIIIIVLDRAYSWLPGFVTFISKLAARDAATYGLIFTILISLAGFCAFPQMWPSRIVEPRKEQNNSDIRSMLKELFKQILVLVILPLAVAYVMHEVNLFFKCYFDTNLASSDNQNNLNKEKESNSLASLLWIGIFGPISEELLFRQLIIGFFTSRLINRIALIKSSVVQQTIPLLKSAIVFVSIFLSGMSFGLSHDEHFNFIMAGYATFGVILGFAYYIGKGHVIHSILPHMLYNLIFAS